MKCQNCNFEDEGKYCSNCGKLLANSDVSLPIKREDIKIQGWYVSISFGKSSSPNFSKALAMAKAAPEYIESTDENGKPAAGRRSRPW